MTCKRADILEILKKNKVDLSPRSDLAKLVVLFSDDNVTVKQRQIMLNTVIAGAIQTRNNLLTDAFGNKIPKNHKIEFEPIEITDADIQKLLRHTKNAAKNILENTIEIGSTDNKHFLREFVEASRRKLTVLFEKTMQIKEYLLSDEGKDFLINKANDSDKNVLRFLTVASQKINDWFYTGANGEPVLSYMNKGTQKFFINNLINGDGTVKGKKFSLTDALRYFLRGDVATGDFTVDPMVLEAINQAVYNWQSTFAADTFTNDDADINRIFGRDSRTSVKPEHRRLFYSIGSVQAVVIESIGKEAFRLLGLKAKNDVEGNFSNKLEVALGELAVAYMLDTGILQQTSVPNSAFPNDSGDFSESQESKGDGNHNTLFVKIKNRDRIILIANERRDTENIDEILGDENYKKFPSTRPVTSVDDKLRRSRQNVPEKVKTVLGKLQREPWKIKQTVTDSLFSLSEGLQNFILGINTDIDNAHVTQREKIEADNNRILRSIENIKDFAKKVKSKPFYMKYFVSKTGRIFIDNNTVDPVQDKIIRHLIGLEVYDALVDTTEQRIAFKMAIAQAFGVSIDKKSQQHVMQEFDEILINTAEAVEALRKGSIDEKGEALIRDAMEDGEGLATYEALLALVNYSTTEPFETNIAIETDAVTSGVAIGMMQTLLDGTNDLESVGVFLDGVTDSFPSWKSKIGNFDLYEKLTILWSTKIDEKAKKEGQILLYKAIDNIVGSFTDENGLVNSIGRNFAKYPLMITNYGGSVVSSVNGFSEEVLTKFYEQLAEATTKAQIDSMIGRASRITGSEVIYDHELNSPKEFTLTPKQEIAFKNTIVETYGNSLGAALNERLGSFMEFRENINHAFQVMFAIFESQFNRKIEAETKRLGRTLSLNETEAIIDSLQHLAPIAKGPLSTGIADGIAAIKEDIRRQYTSEYKVQQQYAQNLNNTIGTDKSSGSKSLTSYASTYEFGNPGIAGTVINIHNLDSAIQQAMLSTVSALNIHDAGMYSINDVIEGTSAYNKAFLELNRDFNIGQEVFNSFRDVVSALAKLPAEDRRAASENIKGVMERVKIVVPGKDKKQPYDIREHVARFNKMLREIEVNKKALFDENDSIVVSHSAHSSDSTHVHTKKDNLDTGEDLVEAVIEALGDSVSTKTKNKVEQIVNQNIIDRQDTSQTSLELSGENPDTVTPIAPKTILQIERRSIKEQIKNIEKQIEDLFKSSVTVIQFVSSKGGLNRDDFKSQGIDPENFKTKPVTFGKPIFPKKGGLTTDGLAEVLNEENFRGRNDYDAHDAFEVISDALADIDSELFDVNANISLSFLNDMLVDLDNQVDFITKQIDTIFNEVKEKGSSNRTIDFENFQALFSDTIDASSMQTIFDHLVSIGNKADTKEHTNRLRELMDNLIRIQGSIDLNVGETDGETFGVQRTFDNDTKDIHVVGSVSAVKNNAQLSAQEVYVHELLHAVTEYGIDSNTSIRNALKRLFDQAKKHFTWKDFLPEGITNTTPAEIETAKETYNYIFNNTTEKDNPYLHEFVAYGLSNENVAKKLATIPIRDSKKISSSLLEQLRNWFGELVDYIVDRITGVQGTTADVALRLLVDKLVSTHDRKKFNIFRHLEVFDGLNGKTIDALNNFIFRPLMDFRKNSTATHIPGRILKTIGGLLDSDNHKALGKVIKQVSKNIGITERSFITKLVREMQGLTKNNAAWHSLLRMSKKVVDQARLHEADNVIKQLRNSFHTEVSKEENEALYKVFMKTDLVALLDTHEKGKYSPEDVINLLSEPDTLSRFIDSVEKQLIGKEYGTNARYYLNQARGLGKLMATGQDFMPRQMRNAYLIANLSNTGATVTGDLRKAESLIDELATLYAVQNTNKDIRNRARTVYQRENAVDGLENGITMLLNLHALNKEESLRRLFNDEKGLVQKGYTRETFNPNIDVKISVKGLVEKDGKMVKREDLLKEQGYVQIGDKPLDKDPNDPSDEKRYLFVNQNSANADWVKSIVSLTSKKAQGNTIEEIFANIQSDSTYDDAQKAIKNINRSTDKLVENQFKKGNSSDTSLLLPIVNENGQTVTYRYIMSEHVKDTILERDNRFEYAMGRMFGTITDKVNSQDVNSKVLNLAMNDFNENFAENPGSFIDIGSNSTDPELKEIYDLLPQEMKNEMRKLWGKGQPIMIREEFINLIFGFRKLKLKDKDNMIGAGIRGLNESVTWLMQNTFFPEAPNADIGRLWTEVVDLAKELIVVKTGVILLPNFISNNILLLIKGVPPSSLIRHQTEAVIELDKYRKDLSRRDILVRELKANKEMSDKKLTRLKTELGQLNDDLNKNPVSTLIDEGIFQSIIEDVDFEEDLFTSRAKLGAKVQQVADRYLNEYAVDAYRYLYLTKDTAPYQVLLKTIQMSDFISRYALYRHRMDNIPKDVKSKDQKESYRLNTLAEVVESFINYDVPTSREMQWVNDVGLLMFTKFYFRIQKIILRQFKERPASTMGFYGVEELFGKMDDIGDTNILFGTVFNRANTPFDIIDQATDIPAYELLS